MRSVRRRGRNLEDEENDNTRIKYITERMKRRGEENKMNNAMVLCHLRNCRT
jgi:hypothetical protein